MKLKWAILITTCIGILLPIARRNIEREMSQITAQRRGTLAQPIWRAAIIGLVILFLCASPAGATIICNCPPEAISTHVCHQTMKSLKLSENKHQNHTGGKKASHCQTTKSAYTHPQVRKSAQHTMRCCEVTPQRELENAELSPPTPMGAEENYPLPDISYPHEAQAPLSIPEHPREQQRPLYIALSCWLI